MPASKHKRKASTRSKSKAVINTQPSGLITSHPRFFLLFGMCLVTLSLYLLTFESHHNAMFGFAMLSLITGVVLAILAKITASKKDPK
jgi:hypothetical protein